MRYSEALQNSYPGEAHHSAEIVDDSLIDGTFDLLHSFFGVIFSMHAESCDEFTARGPPNTLLRYLTASNDVLYRHLSTLGYCRRYWLCEAGSTATRVVMT